MKIETFPLIAGLLIALFGIALFLDGRLPDGEPGTERRRRVRRERSRGGEQVIGLGVIALGVSIAGRDTWRYSILAMLIGAALILVGTWANRSYLRELLANRGASRRRDGRLQDLPAPGAPTGQADQEKRPRVR